MTNPLIYNTGTVAVENGSTVVVGTGTGWAVALVTGGLLSCAGMSIPIAAVESDTSLTLAYAWPGLTVSGQPYAISKAISEAISIAWTNTNLAKISAQLSLLGIHPDGSGTLAERDALDPVPSTGYIWLYLEAGYDPSFYKKIDSGWGGPFPVRGEAGAAASIGDVTGLTAALAAKAPLASPAFTGAPTAPTAAASTNTTQIATTAFVQAAFGSQDAMIFKGVIDCSASPNYPAADRGWVWRVSAAGKIGGASGVNVEVGDVLTCLTDGTAAGNQATVGAAWTITQANIDGAVIGPAASVDGNFMLADGPTGKKIKDAGKKPSDFAPAGNYLKDALFNFLSDSGRFTGPSDKGITVGSFAYPSYLIVMNGTTAADGGKFISNNNDYGGSAGSLPSAIKDLIDKIRGPTWRRYGPEFRVAQLTMGSGTTTGFVVGGNTYYLSTYFNQYPRFPSQTFHYYVRALDAPIAVNKESSQQIFLRDGVVTAAPFTIAPADGWASITVQDPTDPYNSLGYIPRPILLYAGAAGNRFLLACPALLPGITNVPDSVGVIPGLNIYS